MLNIFNFLNGLGLTAQNRAIQVSFSNTELNNQLFLGHYSAEHTINNGIRAELICLSTNTLIPLKDLIACQVAVDIRTDMGQLFRQSGIVTGAEAGQSDGSLSCYKLTVEDATSLWRQRRNSRVFMEKSVIDVVNIIFKEWQKKSPLFAKSLSLDLNGLQKQYDIRPFIMQANQTDLEFVSNLLRSEAVNWSVDETKLCIHDSSENIQPQILRLIDDNRHFKKLDRGTIRYHRSNATEKTDTLVNLIAQRALQPTAVHVQRWQADDFEQTDWPGSFLSNQKHSSNYKNDSLNLEQSWHLSPAWIKDLKGQDTVTKSGNQQLERINSNFRKHYDLKAKQFIAEGTVRDVQVGYWFELNGHPEIDQHSGSDKEFLILSKYCVHQNNLPKDLSEQVDHLLGQNHWNINLETTQERQACKLILVRHNIPVVPEYDPQKHRAHAYPLRAMVVGPQNEEVHVDEWGRIKVRFLFTRPEDHIHDGGAGSNNNETDSAWVPILTPWASEGFGARFLPRIGDVVAIDFFNGDVDQPFVSGRIHEAHKQPSRFDKKGKLPNTRYLSGIRSSEIGGSGGFGQLRFDDTKGQISSQLQSSFASTQVNLGQLSHPKDSESSKDRGTGFEVRTDSSGAIRAGAGLLLTSYIQGNAAGDHMNAEEAKQQLKVSYNYAKSLSNVAKQHQTTEITTIDQLMSFAESIQKDIAKFNNALLLITSPQGIGLSTAGDIHLSADKDINQIANGYIHLSTQKNLIAQAIEKVSLFSSKQGIDMIAAHGKVGIQAQTDAMDIIADQVLKISSKKESVVISADKEILFNVQGNYIKITADNIELGTKGEIKAYTTLLSKLGPKTINYELPKDPYNEMFILNDPKGNPIAGFAYKLITSDGQVFRGVTNEKGETIRLDSGYDTTQLEIHADDGKDDNDNDSNNPDDAE